MALFLCQAKGEHSRLAPHELRPCLPGNRKRLYSQAGVCGKEQCSNSLFFLLHKNGVADKIRACAGS